MKLLYQNKNRLILDINYEEEIYLKYMILNTNVLKSKDNNFKFKFYSNKLKINNGFKFNKIIIEDLYKYIVYMLECMNSDNEYFNEMNLFYRKEKILNIKKNMKKKK
jgi:hypothetical protein